MAFDMSSRKGMIAIIGGGASGVFAGIAAAEKANKAGVVVFEGGPKTLSKVKISGGGRCNVLHDTALPVKEILSCYPRGRKEITGLYNKHFTPKHARQWFTSRGVELKTEDDGRMFPTTDDSQTIIDTLLNAADDAGVEIRRKQKVMSVSRDPLGGSFVVETTQFPQERFDCVILATGSSASGYAMANELGHTIVDPIPSLFTLSTKNLVKEGGLLHGLSGVSVPDVRLSLRMKNNTINKSKKLKQEGPLLITHHGISGPAALRLSAFGAREFHEIGYRSIVRVHWAPACGSVDDIAEELWKMRLTSPKRAVATLCPLNIVDRDYVTDETVSYPAIPKRLWASMVRHTGIGRGKMWCEVSKKKVRKLAHMVAESELEVTGKGVFKEEFVTAGGVSLKEIDMKTMESKVCPGLFLCGEVIDVDGVTGGFNFMNCWSTGYSAGTGAAGYLAPEVAGV